MGGTKAWGAEHESRGMPLPMSSDGTAVRRSVANGLKDKTGKTGKQTSQMGETYLRPLVVVIPQHCTTLCAKAALGCAHLGDAVVRVELDWGNVDPSHVSS